MNKIEETREYLINKYGEPYEKIIDGRKHRFVNVDLENFDKLLYVLTVAGDMINFELNDTHKNVICDFIKCENPGNVTIVIKKIESLIKQWNKNVNYSKSNFKKMFKRLEEDYMKKDFKPAIIMNYFVEFLRCSKFSNKETFMSLM